MRVKIVDGVPDKRRGKCKVLSRLYDLYDIIICTTSVNCIECLVLLFKILSIVSPGPVG